MRNSPVEGSIVPKSPTCLQRESPLIEGFNKVTDTNVFPSVDIGPLVSRVEQQIDEFARFTFAEIVIKHFQLVKRLGCQQSVVNSSGLHCETFIVVRMIM